MLLDATPPTAYLSWQHPVEGRGFEYIDVFVAYIEDEAGDSGMNVATLGDGDVVVTGPNGYAATGVYVPSTRPRTYFQALDAHYRVPAPGGTFDETDNGDYVVNVVPGEVTDLAGNSPVRDPVQVPGEGGVGSITVNVPPQDGPDLYVSAGEPVTPVKVLEDRERRARPPLRVTLTNVGNALSRGTARIFAWAGDVTDVVGELPRQRIDLAPGESKTFRLKNKPWTRFGRERWDVGGAVEADASVDRHAGNNRRTFGSYELVYRPRVDLRLGPPTLEAPSGVFRGGTKVKLSFPVTNLGQAHANGRLIAGVTLVQDPAQAAGGGWDIPVTIRARAGAAGIGRGVLTLPWWLSGDYYIAIQFLTKQPWRDSNPLVQTAVAAAPVHIERGESP